MFIPHLHKSLETVQRVDIVFYIYLDKSLKQATRRKRGSGVPIRITEKTHVPTNWKNFLRVDNNKQELFVFLAEQINKIHIMEGKKLVVTIKENVIVLPVSDHKSSLEPCYHEEADTRMFLHA